MRDSGKFIFQWMPTPVGTGALREILAYQQVFHISGRIEGRELRLTESVMGDHIFATLLFSDTFRFCLKPSGPSSSSEQPGSGCPMESVAVTSTCSLTRRSHTKTIITQDYNPSIYNYYSRQSPRARGMRVSLWPVAYVKTPP